VTESERLALLDTLMTQHLETVVQRAQAIVRTHRLSLDPWELIGYAFERIAVMDDPPFDESQSDKFVALVSTWMKYRVLDQFNETKAARQHVWLDKEIPSPNSNERNTALNLIGGAIPISDNSNPEKRTRLQRQSEERLEVLKISIEEDLLSMKETLLQERTALLGLPASPDRNRQIGKLNARWAGYQAISTLMAEYFLAALDEATRESLPDWERKTYRDLETRFHVPINRISRLAQPFFQKIAQHGITLRLLAPPKPRAPHRQRPQKSSA